MEPEIRQGDLILLQYGKDPVSGDVVAAYVQGHGVTLKYFLPKEGGKITLRPLNKKRHKDWTVPAEDVLIQGVWVETVRRKPQKKI